MPQALSADVYKYQNEQGKWVFTDKKPTTSAAAETISYETNIEEKNEPRTYITTDNNIEIRNPFYIPIEIKLRDENDELFYHSTVGANTTKTISRGGDYSPNYTYSWLRGDPSSTHASTHYQTPFKSSFKRKITQAFNGKFSHNSRGSRHAVDIALPVGTPIVAARAGAVIYTKDDYAFSGRSKYFLDKANRVEVLHDDGTYAVYAHLLQGTVKVDIGDTVSAGTELGKSGSSGFSTGPHLHFVIRKNNGFETVSVPFKLSDNNGQAYTPIAGYYIQANR
jgi:murein DD-endopeptidase MepM/ murein hydrolase activator NlpD